jgi:hypothetical protein
MFEVEEGSLATYPAKAWRPLKNEILVKAEC